MSLQTRFRVCLSLGDLVPQKWSLKLLLLLLPQLLLLLHPLMPPNPPHFLVALGLRHLEGLALFPVRKRQSLQRPLSNLPPPSRPRKSLPSHCSVLDRLQMVMLRMLPRPSSPLALAPQPRVLHPNSSSILLPLHPLRRS